MEDKIHDIYSKDFFSPIHGYPTRFRALKKILQIKARYYKNRLKYGDAAPNPFKVKYVNPNKIERVTTRGVTVHNQRYKDFGKIKDGNWDRRNLEELEKMYMDQGKSLHFRMYVSNKFDETPFHKSMKQRFEQGKNWEDTPYYEYLKKKDKLHWQEEKDQLYNSIKENSLQEINEFRDRPLNKPLEDISIDIGRNGKMMLVDNRHRLSIAKILDIDQVPVRVVCTHKKWQEKDKKL